jgi:hypothetical protein
MDLRKLNSVTKYPSIETYHKIGDRGVLTDEVQGGPPAGPLLATEKIDGVNVRIILTNGTNGESDWFIGSREELLTCRGDRVRPVGKGVEAMIVRDMLPTADRLSRTLTTPGVFCVYGELYGDKDTPEWRRYGAGEQQFRVFDMVNIQGNKLGIFDCEPDVIGSWRQQGKQPFMDVPEMIEMCTFLDLVYVPPIQGLFSEALPTGVAEIHEWMNERLPKSLASLDTADSPKAHWPEGIVLRDPKRTWIRKLRFEQYNRTAASKSAKVKA